MTHSPVTVIIPTFRRPNSLIRAVLSIYEQGDVPAFDLILVDNDPDGSADQVMQSLADRCPGHIRLTCLAEPAAGVANARNMAMRHVRTRLVAFLDDDQTAADNWLSGLLSSHASFPAAVTFGPVATILPKTITRHHAYLGGFFARQPDLPTGYINEYFGCGNALLDLDQLPDLRPLFDAAMNESGGEDDMLFSKLKKLGCRFAWCAEAAVSEHVPEDRARLAYTLKRAFSYGQGPVTMVLLSQPQRIDKLLFWMSVGAAKAFANLLIFAALFLGRVSGHAEYLDRAARGLGKVFWWIDFNFYGTALLDNQPLRRRPVRGGVHSADA